jgi:hypothetical protein
VSLPGVSARFFVGVGAWLLGAAAATGGSLFAVSLLGQSLAPAPSQQLTVTAVNRALAGEAAEGPRSAPPATPSASPSPRPARRHPQPRRSAPAAPAAATPAATAPAPQATSAVLTSSGGTVLASCGTGGAYLVSWSPQQGYEILSVVRGPVATAVAKFANEQRVVTMKVSCGTGSPTATTSVHRPGDDGTGHDS